MEKESHRSYLDYSWNATFKKEVPFKEMLASNGNRFRKNHMRDKCSIPFV